MTSHAAALNETEARHSFNVKPKKRLRRILSYLKKPAIAAVVLALADAAVLLTVLGVPGIRTLVLVLLLEGGLGLLAGTGIVLSSTPSISRVGETVLGTAPWSREAERNAERVGLMWILCASFLITIGFALSIL